ncbi:voltage-dependent calcium channel subunit alpha-2/delta-2-like [Littorina saxatilis]|uniref:voltage-dependent calcium channel subunit alpha-2/delta-2-like n=1 Tax=Littorina saxatilis TaxID=31220 RepID=UPI0038B6A9A5
MDTKRILQLLLYISMPCAIATKAYRGEEKHDIGTLAGDVQNWAMLIQNYILQLASDGINKHITQSLLDQAKYKSEIKDGRELVDQVKEELGVYFQNKIQAAERLAEKVLELHDSFLEQNMTIDADRLNDLTADVYKDSDIPTRLPPDLKFSPYFQQKVSKRFSTVKIADEVPREHQSVINTVHFTKGLEKVFIENAETDALLRWQYFGSTTGVTRLYPGREWSTNFAGFYNDYDPRVRPWYIAATSGPKDVIIVLDCSLSIKGEKFAIAKAVAKNVIRTLTKQDYVNVICSRASHWNEVGKWYMYDTDVLSCQKKRMVPATNAHRKDLIEKIDKLKAGGTTELQKAFDITFELLRSVPRTGCQSIIVFATDGLDTDGEQVRCGPGYYTRSGYVPGPICRYNWTEVYNLAMEKNKYLNPPARVFSYLIVEDAEIFPGKLACDHNGSMKKLLTGENLISQMSNYYEFLSSNAVTAYGLWTSPYLDSWGLGLMLTYSIPITSKVTGKYIGVVGIDASLDVIENFLSKHQWGSVYSFLINNNGETIFHPRLKPSKKLLEDPIFIPISQLEMHLGKPAEFLELMQHMLAGESGVLFFPKARDGKPRTFYYGALEDSEYAFAFSLAEEDKEFRRSQEPEDRSKIGKSYYNLLEEYNSTLMRQRLSGVFEEIDVRENDSRYPGLRISYKFSTIFLAPQSHCDPIKYMYNDSLAAKTVDAHLWINGYQEDLGCETGLQKFDKGVRADVLITQPIEEIWRTRNFDSIDKIKWTNVGLRSGVFRTYPGHRSTRGYDPTQRPWYKRTSSAPHKTSISTPYMDSAGVGKINTISQAVFEGMTPKNDHDCDDIEVGKKLGGCPCEEDTDCLMKVCYLSKAPGFGAERHRCATERVEGVTGLDILYDDFHNRTMESMQASDFRKSCGLAYQCPDGVEDCQTRCYLFDSGAYLVVDPDFLTASALDESRYEQVTLGSKEGEVMKHLVNKHHFFRRKESIDFQGSCRITPSEPKVTLQGLPQKPEDYDDYQKNRGPIPKFHNDFGCIQDVVSFSANDENLGPSGMITGNVSGPCMSGFYYVTAMPKTNLYLLVIENYRIFKKSIFYDFNCKMTRSVVNSGAYRIVNGTCAHEDTTETTLAQQNMCPDLRDISIKCSFLTASSMTASGLLILAGVFASLWT